MTYLWVLPVFVLAGLLFLSVISILTFEWHQKEKNLYSTDYPWYVRVAKRLQLW